MRTRHDAAVGFLSPTPADLAAGTAVPRHEYPTLTALRQDASHQARRQAGLTGQMPHQRPHGIATPHLIAARYLQALDQPATFITQKVLPEPASKEPQTPSLSQLRSTLHVRRAAPHPDPDEKQG
jgi:hypothetical protein